MQQSTALPYDGLWPDQNIISWHIPVRCRSGFDGQLPLPETLVPNSDAVAAILKALHNPYCQVVALVGAAGTGKTTALGSLLHSLGTSPDVNVSAMRCSSRKVADLQEFLSKSLIPDSPQWLVIDGLDELRGDITASVDKLLQPIIPYLLNDNLRILFSVRPDVARGFLVPPAEGLLSTIEWDEAWSGVQTSAGLKIAILQLQELRHRDVELYARRRGLHLSFVAHLRRLYDLRELVRRFFLLVKLCDLSRQLEPAEWMRIHDRNDLYERLLTTWLTVERERNLARLPLGPGDLLTVLERAALHMYRWTGTDSLALSVQLSETLRSVGGGELRGSDAGLIAGALVNSNIVVNTGFAHKSIEEYLLARSLATLMRTGVAESLAPSRVTDDVIGFLAENEEFRTWLDQHQDQLSVINKEYLPYVIRLLHRQGRAVSDLDLRGAKLTNLQLPGLRLRKADLRGADLEGTQLGPADLTLADLRGAVLRHATVWSTQRATEIYPSSDGTDKVWLVRPSPDRSADEVVLIQIGSNSGRIAAAYRYDARAERLLSDGRGLYRLPKAARNRISEAVYWAGEKVAADSWSLLPDAIPLTSVAMPGTVWNISSDQVVLYDDDGMQQTFSHSNGSVKGVIGVPDGSSFSRSGIDGFCLVGSNLWVISTHSHAQLLNEMHLSQPFHHIVAVGETHVIFKASHNWYSWTPTDEHPSAHPELAEVQRVIAIPEGGFAMISPSSVDFYDGNLSAPLTRRVEIGTHCIDMVGIKSEGRRALVILSHESQWLSIVDEQGKVDKPEWIRLRASGARFDATTLLNNDLRLTLVGAGARDDSEVPQAPELGSSIFLSQQVPDRFDVLLITVNKHEFNAVYDLAQERLGKEPPPIYLARTYYDLGFIGGTRVALVRSEMGSGQPGGTTTTTLQAIRDLEPRYVIAVGILFGVDPSKQNIGQVFYSSQLQCYELQKVATDEKTGALKIIPRGDKVKPNTVFLDRMWDAAISWPEGRAEGRPSPILLLSGDKLVDNIDFRDQQLLLMSPEAEGGEMEASGIYTASREYETRWMVVKAISDYADGQKRENKEARQQLAAGKAARFVFHLLERGGLI